MLRMRPQNWDRVLSSYRLGWAENQRQACLHNLGPLSSLVRAFGFAPEGKSAEQVHTELVALGERCYDAHLFCPDGGSYGMAPDGQTVACSVHGTAACPRQPAAPSERSDLGRLLREFADMTLTLTFLEDGLHAVVSVERK